MNEFFQFIQENMGAVITFVSGGGLAGWATSKYAKKSAEAGAMKEWQVVYQETIKDLREDKDLLKVDINELRKVVDQNTVDIEELKNYECIVVDCALRKKRTRTIKPDYDEKNK